MKCPVCRIVMENRPRNGFWIVFYCSNKNCNVNLMKIDQKNSLKNLFDNPK